MATGYASLCGNITLPTDPARSLGTDGRAGIFASGLNLDGDGQAKDSPPPPMAAQSGDRDVAVTGSLGHRAHHG